MQTKRNKKKSTRTQQSAEEKKFMLWVKDQDCIVCGEYPCIVDHCMGQTYINNKVQVGHWWIIPLCAHCDDIKTGGSRRGFINQFGLMSTMWNRLRMKYAASVPEDVIQSISDSNM
jgi:hypothetical protein